MTNTKQGAAELRRNDQGLPWQKEPSEAQRHLRNVGIARGHMAEIAKQTGQPLALDIALTLAKVEREWKPITKKAK